MKRILFILFVITLAACNSIGTKPTITDEAFNPSIDSLYAQCQELKGLGNLQIGKTTLRQVKRDKGITMPEFMRSPSFINGHWGISALSNYELGEYLDKKATSIKQFQISDCIHKYKIGEIEIEDVCLAFYRDTLVAISFDCTGDILNHYIEKYGNGKGNKYTYSFVKGKYGTPNFTFESKHIENRTWANERVTMEYKYHWEQRTAPNERDRILSSESCIISSNSRYDLFLSTLEKYKAQYREEQSAKKKASFDSL